MRACACEASGGKESFVGMEGLEGLLAMLRNGGGNGEAGTGLEGVKARITEDNAFDVLRRCDELEAALDVAGERAAARSAAAAAASATTATASTSTTQQRARGGNGTRTSPPPASNQMPANDAYRNFVYAWEAQESSRRATDEEYMGRQSGTRRPETVARETLFPYPDSHEPGPHPSLSRRGGRSTSVRRGMPASSYSTSYTRRRRCETRSSSASAMRSSATASTSRSVPRMSRSSSTR